MSSDGGRPKMTPKDFFLYLAAAATLYVSAGSLLGLLFRTIDASFPDALSYGDFYSSGIRFAIAALIVAFPLFLVVSWRIQKDIAHDTSRAAIAIRKWYIGFTLFVAGAAVAGDLVAVVNAFLGGELAARFFLKALAVLVVAGAVFGYYLYALRRSPQSKPSKTLIGVAIVAVLAALVWGFAVLGSPSAQRDLRFDERRVNDLQSIQWQVIDYWQGKEALPATLDTLSDPVRGFRVPVDPETDEAYAYRVTGARSFELCATFARVLGEKESASLARDYYGPSAEWSWAHDVGEACFERTIDPDFFPPRKAL